MGFAERKYGKDHKSRCGHCGRETKNEKYKVYCSVACASAAQRKKKEGK